MSWVYYYHIVMVVILIMIILLTELISGNSKDTKEKRSNMVSIEDLFKFGVIFIAAIVVVVISVMGVINESVIVIGISRILGVAYVYLAFKQILRMIFVSENRAFSKSDIKDFVFSYMIALSLMLLLREKVVNIGIIDAYVTPYQDVVKVGVMFGCIYFNLLFALGGVYVFLYYIWLLCKKIGMRIITLNEWAQKCIYKISSIYNKETCNIVDFKCVKIWKNGNCIWIKAFCSLPLFIFDVLHIIFIFVREAIVMTMLLIIAITFDPIREIKTLISIIWNTHKNNVWMYIIAQVAGLASFIIVFIEIQYGNYSDTVKNTYEFLGTIALIPYFLSKIMKVKQQSKIDESLSDLKGINHENYE